MLKYNVYVNGKYHHSNASFKDYTHDVGKEGINSIGTTTAVVKVEVIGSNGDRIWF
jgi:surface antigen